MYGHSALWDRWHLIWDILYLVSGFLLRSSLLHFYWTIRGSSAAVFWAATGINPERLVISVTPSVERRLEKSMNIRAVPGWKSWRVSCVILSHLVHHGTQIAGWLDGLLNMENPIDIHLFLWMLQRRSLRDQKCMFWKPPQMSSFKTQMLVDYCMGLAAILFKSIRCTGDCRKPSG